MLERCVVDGLDQYDDDHRRWPSGVLDSAPDPSLMLGEAGVALFLMRVAVASAPSVLLLRSHATNVLSWPVERLGAERLASEEIRAAYGRTLERFVRLGATTSSDTTTVVADFQADLVATRATIARAIGTAAFTQRQLLSDAFLQDQVAGELVESNPLLTVSLFASLTRAGQQLDEVTAWRLSPLVRLVRQRYRWADWAASGMLAKAPARGDEFILLVYRYSHVESREIGALTHVLLAALQKNPKRGATIPQLLKAVASSAGVSDADDGHLRNVVLAQFSAFLRAGIVDVAARP
jgi:hypothetical protein